MCEVLKHAQNLGVPALRNEYGAPGPVGALAGAGRGGRWLSRSSCRCSRVSRPSARATPTVRHPEADRVGACGRTRRGGRRARVSRRPRPSHAGRRGAARPGRYSHSVDRCPHGSARRPRSGKPATRALRLSLAVSERREVRDPPFSAFHALTVAMPFRASPSGHPSPPRRAMHTPASRVPHSRPRMRTCRRVCRGPGSSPRRLVAPAWAR